MTMHFQTAHNKPALFSRLALRFVSTLTAATLCCALVACDGAGSDKQGDANAASARVNSLLQSMTLEQKIGQMIQGEIKSVTPEDVRRYGLGSVLNGGGSFPGGDKHARLEDWLALADSYYRASIDTTAGNAGIPIIWGTDAVHGHNNVIGATLFPHNIALGAANDPQLAARITAATAREVKATGIDWIFAPTIAVAQDPRWGRTYESFSSDPKRVAQFAAPLVKAMQDEGVVATAKHFIGDGGTFRGIDQGDTRLPLDELLAKHGLGYYEALDAGVLTVMATFNSWNGAKVHGSKTLLTDVLKEQLGFSGFVVSDWNGIGQVKGCTNDDCIQAINAGIDMVMAPEDWKSLHKKMVEQVRGGDIPLARIDDAVRRILSVKAAIGLLDRKAPSEEAQSLMAEVGSAAHRELAREAVRRSQVLLKNRGGLVPLDPRSSLLVTGPGADDIGQQSGGWTVSWQGTGNTNEDFPGGTSILEGIKRQVEVAGGAVITDPDGTADAVVYVFGETPYAEGVGDIESLAWQQRSKQDLQAIRQYRERGMPVVAVFLSGRPRWVNAEINASDAFIAAWLPGTEGEGVADVLLKGAMGQVQYDFEGRLPMAWPKLDLNEANADLPVADVLFPIGYGLQAGEAKDVSDLPESAVGVLETAAEILFEGSVRAPWMLYLSDERDPALAAGPANARSAAGRLTVSLVDREVQEDARRLVWAESDQPSGVYFGRGQAWDASGLAAENAAVVLSVRKPKQTESTAALKLVAGCGSECAAAVDLSETLDKVVADQWADIAIPLECLVAGGLNIAQVTSPAGFVSTGPLTLEFSAVAVTPQVPASALVVGCDPL